MTGAGHYLAGAYIVAFLLVLACVLIVASKLRRLERALRDLSVVLEVQEDEIER